MSKDTSTVAAGAAGAAFGGPVGALAAGAGASLVSNGIQQMFSGSEQARYERAMRQNYEYGQMAQRNSAKNMVEGYKMAGLSPALAAGANFSPAQVQSAPLQNKSAFPIDVVGALRVGKELEMAQSQKDNLDEQTRSMKIDNDRKEDADNNYDIMIDNTVRQWFENEKDPQMRKIYEDILNDEGRWTKGVFDALKDITDYSAFIKESVARGEQADLDAMIAEMRQMNGIYKAMAQMPEEELKLLYQESVLKRALAMNAYAQTKTEGEKQKQLQAEQKELEAKAKNIDEQTSRLRYGKYGNMYEHGDYAAAMAEITGNVVEHTGKEIGSEGAKLGADMIRAKTGTPHGLIRTETKHSQSGSRGGHRRRWTDSRGVLHDMYDEEAFPHGE